MSLRETIKRQKIELNKLKSKESYLLYKDIDAQLYAQGLKLMYIENKLDKIISLLEKDQ